MYVAVYTHKGAAVWVSEEGLEYQDIIFANVTIPNRRGGSFYAGLHRAIRDATFIDEGLDPERPSEKAMRLAREEES
jgi:hypothetical protein